MYKVFLSANLREWALIYFSVKPCVLCVSVLSLFFFNTETQRSQRTTEVIF